MDGAEQSQSDAEIVRKLTGYFRASQDHPSWVQYRTDASRCYLYKEGEQWTAKEKADLKKRGQPPTVNNQVKVTIDRMVGQFVQTRTRSMFRGRNAPKDDPVAATWTDVYRADAQTCGLAFEEREVFEDGQTGGFGVFHWRVTFDDCDQPQIIGEFVDALEVFPDPESRRYDWNKDATFICRAKWMPFEEATARWPDKKLALSALAGAGAPLDSGSTDTDALRNKGFVTFDANSNPIAVCVVECWYKTQEKETLERPSGAKLTRVKTKMKVGVFTYQILLEHGDSPHDTDLFPFVPFFVARKKNGQPYSAILTALPMQDAINKRESKALHLLSVNQAMFEQNSIADKAEFAEELAKPDGLMEVTKLDRVKIEKNVDLAQAQYAMHNDAKVAFRQVTGVNPDALGEGSEIRSGVGVARKVQQTDLILLPGFDNFRRTRGMNARLWLALAQQYYDEPKVLLVTDDLGASKAVDVTMDAIAALKTGLYDVVVDEAPDLVTTQQEQMGLLLQYLPQWLQFGPAWAEVFVHMSDIRDKEAILKLVQGMSGPPTPQPTVSVSLKWEELTPLEKVAWAGKFGMPGLAQAEMEHPQDTATAQRAKTELGREEIRAHTAQDRHANEMDRAEIQARTQIAATTIQAAATVHKTNSDAATKKATASESKAA